VTKDDRAEREVAPAGAGRAAEMRREFDRAFAEPLRRDSAEGGQDMLALRAGNDACVIPLSAVRGLLARPTIVAMPGPLPELLGLAGLRGALIPVFSLAALQGQPLPGDPPAWMLLIEAEGLVGLAFEELLGHISLGRAEIAARPSSDGRAGLAELPQAARVGPSLRAMIDVPSLVAGLRRRAGSSDPQNQE